MTRILYQWGLGPLVEKYGHRCTRFVFQKGRLRTSFRRLSPDLGKPSPGDSGDLLGIVKLHEQFLYHLMADFVFIQVCDGSRLSGYPIVTYHYSRSMVIFIQYCSDTLLKRA